MPLYAISTKGWRMNLKYQKKKNNNNAFNHNLYVKEITYTKINYCLTQEKKKNTPTLYMFEKVL